MLSHECRELLGMRPCWAYSKVLPKNYFDFFTNLMRQYFWQHTCSIPFIIEPSECEYTLAIFNSFSFVGWLNTTNVRTDVANDEANTFFSENSGTIDAQHSHVDVVGGGAFEETPFERHLQPFGTLTKHWHRCFRARCICQECKTHKVQLHHSSTANSHAVCFTSILYTIF